MKIQRIIFVILLYSFLSQAKNPCHTVSIFIQFPGSGWLEWGHTGVGADKEYYDFGPDSSKKIAIYTKGTFFLRNIVDANVENMEKYFAEGRHKKAVEFRAFVTAKSFSSVVDYWVGLSIKFPHFFCFGTQCTTVNYRSMESAGLLPLGSRVALPLSYYKFVKANFRSNCGPEAGDLAHEIILHK